jgi:hypothetical protein
MELTLERLQADLYTSLTAEDLITSSSSHLATLTRSAATRFDTNGLWLSSLVTLATAHATHDYAQDYESTHPVDDTEPGDDTESDDEDEAGNPNY